MPLQCNDESKLFFVISQGVKNRFNSSAYKKWATEMKLVLSGTCVRRKRKDMLMNSNGSQVMSQLHRQTPQQLPQMTHQLHQLQHQQQLQQQQQQMQQQVMQHHQQQQQQRQQQQGSAVELTGMLSDSPRSEETGPQQSVPQLPEPPT